MSAAEYMQWQRFYADEPFGDVRADLRAGVVAATVARTVARRGSRISPLDYMPIVAAQRERVMATHAGRVAAIRNTFESNLGTLSLRHTKIKRS
jgi:hypothetical protein